MIHGVICFGDSVLAGTGASSRDKGCAKLLKLRLNVPVLLKGVNRQTSEDGLARLASDVLERKEGSHVVILFGNNDCRFVGAGQPAVSKDRFVENLKQMAWQIKKNGQIPLFCNLQPIDSVKLFQMFPDFLKYQVPGASDPEKLHGLYSDLIEAFAAENGEYLIDIRAELMKKKEAVVAMDGLHPNDLGHEMIFGKILEALEKQGSLL
jgi:lysophospholipase L1-like esterase